jgi:hypothetical protein
MSDLRRLLPVLLLSGSVAGCSRTERFAVDGVWERGPISGDHGGLIVLSLRDEGTHVTGVACRTSSGHLIYSDVAIDSPYPRVEYNFPSGCRFQGAFVSSDSIYGTWTCGVGLQPWYFRRAPASSYSSCAAALP